MRTTMMYLALSAFVLGSTAGGREVSELAKALKHGALAELTIKVVDTEHNAVSNVSARVGFWNPSNRGRLSEGYTDENGQFTAKGKTTGEVTVFLKNPGYYNTRTKNWLGREKEPFLIDNRWQPWNATNTIILKKIKNPVAMYARNIDAIIPTNDEPIGFDLEKGDWVRPYGNGKLSDLIFEYSRIAEGPQDYSKSLIVSISHAGDGIQVQTLDMYSDFKSMYYAPEVGYQEQIRFERARTSYEILKNQQMEKSEYLVFRVRSKLDKDSKLKSANYGKIYGPIDYGYGRTRNRIRFTYYFNPDGTHNLEYDTNKNLLPPIHSGDRIPEP